MLIYCSFADREPKLHFSARVPTTLALSFSPHLPPTPPQAWLAVNHCGSISKCTQEWESCLQVAFRGLQFDEITLCSETSIYERERESGLFVTARLPLLFDKLKHLLLIIRELSHSLFRLGIRWAPLRSPAWLTPCEEAAQPFLKVKILPLKKERDSWAQDMGGGFVGKPQLEIASFLDTHTQKSLLISFPASGSLNTLQ